MRPLPYTLLLAFLAYLGWFLGNLSAPSLPHLLGEGNRTATDARIALLLTREFGPRRAGGDR